VRLVDEARCLLIESDAEMSGDGGDDGRFLLHLVSTRQAGPSEVSGGSLECPLEDRDRLAFLKPRATCRVLCFPSVEGQCRRNRF
jgi:hypothetical protein